MRPQSPEQGGPGRGTAATQRGSPPDKGDLSQRSLRAGTNGLVGPVRTPAPWQRPVAWAVVLVTQGIPGEWEPARHSLSWEICWEARLERAQAWQPRAGFPGPALPGPPVPHALPASCRERGAEGPGLRLSAAPDFLPMPTDSSRATQGPRRGQALLPEALGPVGPPASLRPGRDSRSSSSEGGRPGGRPAAVCSAHRPRREEGQPRSSPRLPHFPPPRAGGVHWVGLGPA